MIQNDLISYTAIIQLMGVKDLAYVEFEKFNRILSEDSPRISKETVIEIGDCNVITFLDYCICESKNLNNVLSFSIKFRQKLIEEIGILCRGYITSSINPILENGKLACFDYSEDELPENTSFEGYQFKDSNAISVLFSEISRIKGLSLKLDEKICAYIDKNLYFVNYYTEHYDSLIINSYYDLKLDTKEIGQLEINKVFKSLEQYYYWSPKFVSFFIPLFNNMILNWNYKTDIKNEKYNLLNIFSSNYFNKFYRIKGMNLIFLFFIKHKILENEEFRIEHPDVLDALSRNTKLISFLRKESIMEIPQSLFNVKDKFKFFSLLYTKN